MIGVAQTGNLLMERICKHLLTGGYGSCEIIDSVVLERRRGFLWVVFNDGTEPLRLVEWS
jgi:hypothetical protein